MTNKHAASTDDAVATASPAQLLVMLFERLVLDVQRGLEAQRRGDLLETNRQLTHAQDIVLELQNSLPADQFRGGYDLSALYGFLNRRLVLANMRKDASITDDCLEMVTDLCETWRYAALQSVEPVAKGA